MSVRTGDSRVRVRRDDGAPGAEVPRTAGLRTSAGLPGRRESAPQPDTRIPLLEGRPARADASTRDRSQAVRPGLPAPAPDARGFPSACHRGNLPRHLSASSCAAPSCPAPCCPATRRLRRDGCGQRLLALAPPCGAREAGETALSCPARRLSAVATPPRGA